MPPSGLPEEIHIGKTGQYLWMSIASVPIRPLVLGVMYEDIIAMSKNGGHRGYLLPGKWQLKNVGTGDATFSVSYVFRQTRV